MEDRKYGNGKTTGCPTKTFGHDRRRGFTLVELVIVIAIVIILSVISVPIYRGYVDKAKMSEGYALQGAILSAQKAYFSEYGHFLKYKSGELFTGYDSRLGIDARGNKFFTCFRLWQGADEKNMFGIGIIIPDKFSGHSYLHFSYYLDSGKIYVYEDDTL